MLLARRKFVQSSLLFAGTSLLFWGSTRKGWAQSLLRDDRLSIEVQRDPVFSFTKETFERCVGDYFETPGPRGKMVALKLVKIYSFESGPRSTLTTGPIVPTKSFVLLFSAEAPLPELSSIYTLKHPALGEFSVFMTRRDSKGDIFYEAVFTHCC